MKNFGQEGRSFRLVCAPGQIPLVEELLWAEGFRFEPEPFSPLCRRLLACTMPLGASLAAFFGYIYIQDRSSMLPPLALAPERGGRALDLCASPGGKSGFLAQLVGPDGFVLANEPNQTRLATLRANLESLNLLWAGISSRPGEKLPLADASWPAILLDPPCSGWGTEDKHPRVRKLWQGQKLAPLIALQRQLLREAARLLEPAGRLLYSTCTTNEEENEAQIRFAEEELGLERIPLAPFPGFVFEEMPGGAGTLRVNGKASSAQGFYLALLQKPGAGSQGKSELPASLSLSTGALESVNPQSLAGPLCDPALFPKGPIGVFGQKLRFIPEHAEGLLAQAFPWQGALLGRLDPEGNVYWQPRLRCLLPALESSAEAMSQALVLDDLASLRRLLSGQSIQTNIPGRACALWWRNLPLGILSLKQGRALAQFR